MDKLYTAAELLGRILIAFLFLVSGVGKIGGYAGTQAYMASMGVPGALLPLVILTEVGGAIAILVGWKTRWVAWALVPYVIIATAVVHKFWTYEAAQVFTQTSFFYKNLSIIGALIYLGVVGPGRYSIDKA